MLLPSTLKPPYSFPPLATTSGTDSDQCTYLCGNSLGVQPRCVQIYVEAQLKTWATKGVYGHFKSLEESPLEPWLDMDEAVAGPMAKIVGAHKHEVAVMQTLTANLHFLMASFYRPTPQRYKIILEAKAFPSDHYAVESQLEHHGHNPDDAMILIKAPEAQNKDGKNPRLPTQHILDTIDAHADTTALLLLPGIQFYTGQYFDMRRITAYAQAKGIVVGWDLAHAVGNVPVQLHDWNVDFAAWCTYKYLNCGPGAIGGLFVHERHAPFARETQPTNGEAYQPRLTGWWGSSKASRFAMTNTFEPIPGAGGFQLSNPSALDLAAVAASLSVFERTDMATLRAKSLRLTRYLEDLLLHAGDGLDEHYTILTSAEPEERGAQLSVLLAPGLLETVMEVLEDDGVVLDERKPDVIRVAPAPLYNNHEDVWRFNVSFRRALKEAIDAKAKRNGA